MELAYSDPETDSCMRRIIGLVFFVVATILAYQWWGAYSTWMVHAGSEAIWLYVLSYLPIIGGIIGVVVYIYQKGRFVIDPVIIFIISLTIYMIIVEVVWNLLK